MGVAKALLGSVARERCWGALLGGDLGALHKQERGFAVCRLVHHLVLLDGVLHMQWGKYRSGEVVICKEH